MRTHSIEGGGGLNLHVRDWGRSQSPSILLIHGWSQSHLCWAGQFDSPLGNNFHLVAMDIRGHGQSDAPLDAECYTDGALWAEDVSRVIDALELDKPVLVGWSYAGLVICDYIRVYGDEAIAGINLVGAAVGIGEKWFGTHIGPAFLDYAPKACTEDQTEALKAIRALLHACFVAPIDTDDMLLAMGWNMLVHPKVRAHLISRDEDFTPDLDKIEKPVLVTYGSSDTIMLPAMAKLIQQHVSNCQMSEYSGVGHAPFIEAPARFNAELGDFVRRCRSGG